jgi:hypothetical protein
LLVKVLPIPILQFLPEMIEFSNESPEIACCRARDIVSAIRPGMSSAYRPL